ncbi:hypothetical protein B0T14DRAFT_421158 [Immersiella caudata]|uniref:Uncharacterized protein n=1 Tax=Immersiella caudata TaxID=314043 RepID=A0AA39X509_9PEZI|nr:hypothetical protein B0T14DRAFT_421158 [Immersiella caudata]
MASHRTRSPTSASIRSSAKREVASVAPVVRNERSKDSITIAIAQSVALDQLERACVERKGLFRRFFQPTYFTTAERLQETIEDISNTVSGKKKRRPVLNLLVSPDLDETSFHVPSKFRQLRVLRCVPHRDGRYLLIDGSSTYNNVRLDTWQAHRHTQHELVIGHERGVRIKLSNLSRNWSAKRSEFSMDEKEEIRRYFDHLPRQGDTGSWRWEDVKKPVATIVGLVVGGARFSLAIKGAAGGFYTKFAFGKFAFELGAAGAELSVVATAAGGAIVLGAAAGAAIYYIPWNVFFGWLKGAVSWLWDTICHIWERFTGWVRSLFVSGELHEKDSNREGPFRPMSFAS